MAADFRIAVIVALPEEYNAFRKYFPGRLVEKNHVNGINVDVLETSSSTNLNDSKVVRLGLICINKLGNVSGAIVASQILSVFELDHIVNLGLAAGVNPADQALGDVLIAERIRYYESGKLTGRDFRPSAEYIDVKSEVVDELALADFDHWPLGASLSGRPRKVFFGTIASGDKVISNTDFVAALRKYDRKTIGIEMESYGIAAAAVGRRQNFLMIRGICDFANRRKNDGARLSAIEGSVRVFTETVERGYLASTSRRSREKPPDAASPFSIKTRTEIVEGIANNYITKTLTRNLIDDFKFRRSLVVRVAEKFTLGEMRAFCIALKIDLDEIEGSTKTEKAAGLLSYIERRKLMTPEELLSLVELY